MKKKLLTLILAIATCGMMASEATKYEINVAGVEVTSDNCNVITGGDITGGYAAYNASTNTLTCYNLKIYRTGQDNYGIHNRKCDNLKIVFSGTCSVTCADNALKLERGTTLEALSGSNTTLYSSARIVVNLKSYSYTIQGSGKLNVESNQDGYEAIKGEGRSSTNVYFQGAKVVARSLKRSALSSFTAYMRTGADLTIESNGSNASVNDVYFSLAGKVEILEPYGAYVKNNSIYNASGYQITSENIYISDDYVALLKSNYFPDSKFINALFGYFPKGYITSNDVNNTTSLTVTGKSITDMTGINYFSNLTTLDCSYNQLTSLPTLPSRLTLLKCDNNQLSTLPTMPTSIQLIDCSSNKFTSLSVTGRSSLKTLNVSSNNSLTTLNCSNNALTTLNIGSCSQLTQINCSDNKFTTLNISGRSALKTLNVSNNKNLTTLTCSNNALTTLNVSGCTALSSIDCSSNKFTSLSITGCSALKTLNVSSNNSLTTLDCSNNALTTLNIGSCSQLTEVNCSDNKFTTLNISGRSALKTLNVSNNKNLTTLTCSNNALTTLNVSGCTALSSIDCGNNLLTALPTLPNSLQSLDCSSNKFSGKLTVGGYSALKTLNVSNNTGLTYFECWGNALTSLNVQGCTALETLDCANNALTSLPSLPYNLKRLNCSNNRLTSLSSLPSGLITLVCAANQINSLSVKGLNSLEVLTIYANQIKESAMGQLVDDLRTIPAGSTGVFNVRIATDEGNEITAEQVRIARNKRWIPWEYTNGSWVEIPVAGDVNGDGTVNVSDVTTLVNMILKVIPQNLTAGDINGDGSVNVSDVTALVNIILKQ